VTLNITRELAEIPKPPGTTGTPIITPDNNQAIVYGTVFGLVLPCLCILGIAIVLFIIVKKRRKNEPKQLYSFPASSSSFHLNEEEMNGVNRRMSVASNQSLTNKNTGSETESQFQSNKMGLKSNHSGDSSSLQTTNNSHIVGNEQMNVGEEKENTRKPSREKKFSEISKKKFFFFFCDSEPAYVKLAPLKSLKEFYSEITGKIFFTASENSDTKSNIIGQGNEIRIGEKIGRKQKKKKKIFDRF
jgi:hypothetical protein